MANTADEQLPTDCFEDNDEVLRSSDEDADHDSSAPSAAAAAAAAEPRRQQQPLRGDGLVRRSAARVTGGNHDAGVNETNRIGRSTDGKRGELGSNAGLQEVAHTGTHRTPPSASAAARAHQLQLIDDAAWARSMSLAEARLQATMDMVVAVLGNVDKEALQDITKAMDSDLRVDATARQALRAYFQSTATEAAAGRLAEQAVQELRAASPTIGSSGHSHSTNVGKDDDEAGDGGGGRVEDVLRKIKESLRRA